MGSKTETVQQNSKRQGVLGIIGVLGADSVALIDFTVSDGSGSKPGPNYVPGAHRHAAHPPQLGRHGGRYGGDG